MLSSLAPDFYLTDTKAALFDAIKVMSASGKTPCIKRRRGEDAAGFWIIDDRINYASQLFYEAPQRFLSKSILAEMLSGISSEEALPPYMVSEFLPGEEWDCDVLCFKGKMISVTTRINLSMTGGLTSLLEVREHALLTACCERIVTSLQLSYIVCISFRADADGRFFLLEINPRIMGNIYVSALAGNNYVKMAVDLLYGRPVLAVSPTYGIKTALYYDQLLISPSNNLQKME